jgi:hypothetical protein
LSSLNCSIEGEGILLRADGESAKPSHQIGRLVRPGIIEELQLEPEEDETIWDICQKGGYKLDNREMDTVSVKFKRGVEELDCTGPSELTVRYVQESEWFAQEETIALSEDDKPFDVDTPIGAIMEENLSGTIWLGQKGARYAFTDPQEVEIWSPTPVATTVSKGTNATVKTNEKPEGTAEVTTVVEETSVTVVTIHESEATPEATTVLEETSATVVTNEESEATPEAASVLEETSATVVTNDGVGRDRCFPDQILTWSKRRGMHILRNRQDWDGESACPGDEFEAIPRIQGGATPK